VTAQVGSGALVPANSTIVVQVDGESVATRTVRLDAGEATAVEWELPIDLDEITDDPRPVTIRVLGPESTAETTVTVVSETAKPESAAGEESTDSDDGAVSTPGFGPIVTIVALLATAQLARRREGKQ
jgi:PGF-CTERM protein